MTSINDFNRYTISETGLIYDTKLNRELKQYQTKDGYLRIALTHVDGYQKSKAVHRLVAEHFIPNPENLPVVDHINRDRTDNRIENLRWATYSENSQNHKLYSTNKTGIDNVCWSSSKQRWRVSRRVEGKRKHIGYYKTIEEAEYASQTFKETGEIKRPELRSNNTIGHKYITFDSRRNTWGFRKSINGSTHSKSGFKTLEDAISYRDSLKNS